MRFSTQQIERFRGDGYLVVTGFYGPGEVAALLSQDRLQRLRKSPVDTPFRYSAGMLSTLGTRFR